MCEEPERAEPVVDRDDDGAGGRELRTVVVACCVFRETATVDPDEYGMSALTARVSVGRVDVEVQAVLRDRAGREERVPLLLLRTARSELRRVADTGPTIGRLRGAPAKLPNGRSGVRQPAE